MNPRENNGLPIWASDSAFPESPPGYGWADTKGHHHPVSSAEELVELISKDRDARVLLVWTPESPHLVLPEEWAAATEAVREGRRKRLLDDLAESQHRLRWFGLIFLGMLGYMLYQGWLYHGDRFPASQRAMAAIWVAVRSHSVGLTLLMFLIFGFIPWYQARKRIKHWQTNEANDDTLRVIRFETWLELQKAPATRILMAMVALVGMAQLLPGNSIEAAGLMKGPAHQSEWWRVYTAPFLHGNIVHFVMNSAALLYLGKRLEVFARWPHVPLVFLLAAIVGNEASLRLLEAPSVGASGGLMGWLGFLLAFESLHARLVPASARRRLLAGVILTAVIGIIGYQFIDNAAHAGGLAAGILYGLVVFPKSSSAFRPRTTLPDIIAGSIAFSVLALCALLAVFRIIA